MELKELKKEINGVANIDENLLNFKNAWLKQIKHNTNQHFPFLQELDPVTRKEINNNLSTYQKIFNQLKYAQFTQEKLASLAHYLVELKLTCINEDKTKSKRLVNKFLRDDFLKLHNLVDEVHQFTFNLDSLTQLYHRTNKLVLQNIPLEHSLTFVNSPHEKHLKSLVAISQKQKELLRILGTEFISLAKEMRRKKKI
ncbi:hypothetical protein GOV03_05050 [Candidatus Woesearchaeota archaeon]|nr:hypothetical protein [Candidatus Woesearchaeota archaeon]